MSDSSLQSQNDSQGLSLLQISYLIFGLISVILILHYIYTGLKFFYGVDYRMYCAWQAHYLKTGVFYAADTSFYNFPLTVIAFGPYAFLPVETAVVLKCIQTIVLSLFSFVLLFKITGQNLYKNRQVLFIFCILSISFITTQLFYLNIYVEVLSCLLLSLYYYQRNKYWRSALFLCLGVLFKVFLAPLILSAFLSKDYKFFFKSCLCLLVLMVISILVFGFQTHLDMLSAMSATYSKMRISGISYPYVADGFSGYQDFFNKLVAAGALTENMVMPFTLITALFYCCVVFYVFYVIFYIIRKNAFDENSYSKIFATIIVFCLTFNFRFDHGVLLLVIVPCLTLLKEETLHYAVFAVILISLLRFVVVKLLMVVGLVQVSNYLSNLTYFITFQFMGINLLFCFFVRFWLKNFDLCVQRLAAAEGVARSAIWFQGATTLPPEAKEILENGQ